MSSYIVLKNMEKAFKELDKIDEWRLKKMNQTIEQQDFLLEYMKDRMPCRYEIIDDYNFLAETDYYFISVYDFEDNFYCKIQSAEFGNMPPIADFLLPQTFSEFKTIMDIFLGVENGNP